MGVLPIRVETGRFRNLDLENRTCEICHSDDIEDEYHIVMICEKYTDVRRELFCNIAEINISNVDKEEVFSFIMEKKQKSLAKFLVKVMDIRKRTLYA